MAKIIRKQRRVKTMKMVEDEAVVGDALVSRQVVALEQTTQPDIAS